MSCARSIPFLIASFFITLEPSFAQSPSFSIVRAGQFHGEEVSAKDGERWFGVYREPGASRDSVVAEGRLKISAVHDEVLDKEGEATGKMIEFVPDTAQPGELVFVVKGPGIKAGGVRGLGVKLGEPLLPGDGVAAVIEAKDSADKKMSGALSVFATGSVEPTNDENFFRIVRYCVHVATRSKGPALLKHELLCPELNESRPSASIEWLGDLDSDGIPDLLLSTPRFNTDEVRLFLSGQRKDTVLSEVAVFTVTGC